MREEKTMPSFSKRIKNKVLTAIPGSEVECRPFFLIYKGDVLECHGKVSVLPDGKSISLFAYRHPMDPILAEKVEMGFDAESFDEANLFKTYDDAIDFMINGDGVNN
jgi:hypothetical protein